MPPSGETNENATLILILSSKTSQFRIGRRIVSYRIVFERRVDGEPIAPGLEIKNFHDATTSFFVATSDYVVGLIIIIMC